MRSILWLAVLFAPHAWALEEGSWSLEEGSLSYTVTHSFKTVEGRSERVKGKGICAGKECSFLVAVPVSTFTTGNASRDTHMMETMKAALHPLVKMQVDFPSGAAGEIRGRLTVAGKTEEVPFPFRPAAEGKGAFSVETSVPFRLKAFGIEAPSLLGLAVDDLVPVKAKLRFRRLDLPGDQ